MHFPLLFLPLSISLLQLISVVDSTYDRRYPIVALQVTPSELRANSMATVTCTVRFRFSFAKDARITGVETWSEIPTVNKFNFKVKKQYRKRLTAEDNGKVVQCVSGTRVKRHVLNVLYPPRLTKFVPSPRNIPFGSPIICSSDANPAATVTISSCFTFCAWEWTCRWSLTDLAHGTETVRFVVPKNWNSNCHKVGCKAKNKLGQTKYWDRPYKITGTRITARLDLGSLPMPVGVQRLISCEAFGPNLTEIVLQLPGFGLEVRKSPSSSQLQFRANGTRWKQIADDLPFALRRGVTVEKVEVQNSIIVGIVPQTSWDGANVSCVARSFRKGPEHKHRGSISVSWPPSAGHVTISQGSRSPNTVSENSEAIVRCSVQLGRPAVKKSAVRARIGDRSLTNATFSRRAKQDGGLFWILATWRTTVTREEDGADLVCSVGENRTKAIVRVMRQNSPSSIQSSGNAIFQRVVLEKLDMLISLLTDARDKKYVKKKVRENSKDGATE